MYQANEKQDLPFDLFNILMGKKFSNKSALFLSVSGDSEAETKL